MTLVAGARRHPIAVRWRDDVGWELRCPRCVERKVACFWPLTDEFWDRRRMSRCRACEKARQRDQKRHRYQTDPVARERMIASSRTYHADNPGKRTAYNRAKWVVIKGDPILLANERERVRRAQATYRARRRAA